MSSLAPAWRQWSLLAILFAIGIGYVAAFAYFVTRSEDFVANAFNEPARAYASAHPLQTDARLEFGNAGNGAAHLGSGWHKPGDVGSTWSNWPDAWLFFTIAAGTRGVTLHIDADAHLSERRPGMTVTLSGNDVPLKTWKLDASNPRLVGPAVIPAGVLVDQPVALRFHVDAPGSPWRERTGDDMRTLGIRLRTIEVVIPAR